MEKDPERRQPRKNDNRRSSQGGGGLSRLLPFLIPLLLKNRKLTLIAIVVGAVWFFFLGGSDQLFGGLESGGEGAANTGQFSFGAALSEDEYYKADVYEPLSSTPAFGDAALPAKVSLLEYAPARRHQGRQGSCVGWASSYAARTILQARVTGRQPNSVAFSPAYLYNNIALEGCQGAYMNNAMKFLQQQGDLPYTDFGYDERSCSNTGTGTDQSSAAQYRIKGYNRLSSGARDFKVDMNGVRQHLAAGAPVVIGMMVGGSFMHQMVGKNYWQPTQKDYQQYGFSGHAMCVIGYDDDNQAVQLMNSWGPEWGNNGTAWISYRDFQNFTKEAYGLYPMGNAAKYDPDKLAIKFGLIENASQTLIPLKEVGGRVFRTRAPMPKGTKFKVAITNSIECYVYVFGQETDGSSYVLFPYTEKHSPYCGITGTRLFPRDHSMTPDDIGGRDYIAVVVSKKELNWDLLNKRINSSRQRTYIDKVRDAIGQEEIPDVTFSAPDAVEFSCNLKGKNVVATVIEIDK